MYAQASLRNTQHVGVFQRLTIYVLSKLTSRHGKKLIFLTSLYFQFIPTAIADRRHRELDKEAIQKLNRAMELTEDSHALLFPALIRDFVWRDPTICEALRQERLDEVDRERAIALSERIVDGMSNSLRYGRRTDMIDDVVNMISRITTQTAQAA
jgi:hypothetical protein